MCNCFPLLPSDTYIMTQIETSAPFLARRLLSRNILSVIRSSSGPPTKPKQGSDHLRDVRVWPELPPNVKKYHFSGKIILGAYCAIAKRKNEEMKGNCLNCQHCKVRAYVHWQNGQRTQPKTSTKWKRWKLYNGSSRLQTTRQSAILT